jgi:hypothetical protein
MVPSAVGRSQVRLEEEESRPVMGAGRLGLIKTVHGEGNQLAAGLHQ